MKKIVMSLLAAAMLSSLVYAEESSTKAMDAPKAEKIKKNKEAMKKMSVDEMKAKMNERIQVRMKNLQAMQECVNNATTKRQLKECKQEKKMKKKK